MKPFEYSYALIRYRHDVATGEALNVGVVLYAPEIGQVGFLYNPRYARLSEAFAGFDGELYRATLRRFGHALEGIGDRMSGGLFQEEERERYREVGAIVRAVWPDQGMAYFASPARYGVTPDADRELRELYDRFVLSQQDARDVQSRFDDEAMWNRLKKLLTPRGITSVLSFKVLGPAQVEFEHAYKNEKWHVIEPLSLDYANASDIKTRAYETLGKAAAVRDLEEFGSLTLVVAKPRRVEAEKQYLEAMRLLEDLPVPHQIVEEEDAERFAAQLEAEMRARGVLSQPETERDLEMQIR